MLIVIGSAATDHPCPSRRLRTVHNRHGEIRSLIRSVFDCARSYTIVYAGITGHFNDITARISAFNNTDRTSPFRSTWVMIISLISATVKKPPVINVHDPSKSFTAIRQRLQRVVILIELLDRAKTRVIVFKTRSSGEEAFVSQVQENGVGNDTD